MTWLRYEPNDKGKTCVIDGVAAHDVDFELGVIYSGKQRVFCKYYCKILLPDGSTVVGEDKYNLRAAVLDVDGKLKRRGGMLLAAGTDSDWLESGLSQNTGFGYFSDAQRATHIMALPPSRDQDVANDEFVDRMIKEAIDKMFKQKGALATFQCIILDG